MGTASGRAVVIGLLAVLVSLPVHAEPARIVSMGLCTDQLVMLLADPDDIVSVHWVTQDADDSAMASRAARYVANHGLAEEVLELRPSLVFAEATNSPLAIAMLQRQGIRVVTVPVANTFDGVRRNIRLVAKALGRKAEGEAAVASFDAALARTRNALKGLHMRALVYGANGFSAGVPSLFNDVLEHVGLTNIAGRPGMAGWVSMSVEDVLRAQPDLLVLGEYRPGAPSEANLVLEHPALQSLRRTRPVVQVPTNLWNCGTPFVAQAAAELVERVGRAVARGSDR
ncbi:MAG: ABC transporter substrate-binding protein [Alphaproteobacteria bacterium]|nr:ABC transporter substrate-binding protein [Alphaproteobacteria bacterium]